MNPKQRKIKSLLLKMEKIGRELEDLCEDGGSLECELYQVLLITNPGLKRVIKKHCE